MQFKKYICLILSSILLLSNGQIFAQNAAQFSDIISPSEIEALDRLASQISMDYRRNMKNISFDISHLEYSLSDKCIVKTTNPYSTDYILAGSLEKYGADMYALKTSLEEFQTRMKRVYKSYIEALPEGTYLKRATETYLNRRMNDLFEVQNRYADKLLDWTDKVLEEQSKIIDVSKYLDLSLYNEKAKAARLKELYLKDTSARNYFMKDLAEAQTAYEKAFTWDLEKLLDQLKLANASFNKETVEFFSKQNHTANELLEYFLKHGPAEQKATLFALRTTDQGVTTGQLIPYLRYYLKHTNRRLWKLEKYSADNLARSIAKMNFGQKVEYIDNLLDFAPETKALRQEIRQAEKVTGKKIVNRSSLHLGGTFIVLGAALIALTITEFTVGNNYQQSNIQHMAEIRSKMDAGELISLDEMVDYFTNERNEAEIAQNPTLLAEALEAMNTVNTLLDNSGIDLSVSAGELQGNADNAGETIPTSINTGVNNFNYNIITSQIGNIM